MANRIIRPGRGAWNPNQKPPYGAKLNPFHPLSQGLVGAWLFNEGGGNSVWDYANASACSLNNGPVWAKNYLDFVTNQYIQTSIVPFNFERTDRFSVELTVIFDTVVGQQALVGNVLGSPTYKGWNIDRLNQILRFYLLSDYGTTDYFLIDCTFVHSANVPYNIVVTYDGSSTPSGVKFYVDGSLKNNGSTGGIYPISGTTVSTAAMRFARRTDNTLPLDGKLINGFIWKRTLSDSEVASLHANPYQMFWHPVYNDLITTAGIFLKTDYWSITAAPQMVANISVISAFLGILVSAVVSATSTVVASLNLVEIIRATISAVSNVIAALGIRRFISAIITAASSVIANIRSSKFVSAVISAVSSMAANLRLSKFISAIVLGTSNVIAAIKLNKIIRAVISATSSMAANLSLQKIISAVISATSNVIAFIQIKKFISAIISAVSSMAANLRLRKFVSAIISAASSVAANLRLQKFMNVVISATSNVIAALNIQKAIAAIIDAVSSMYGNLTTVGRIMISSIIIAATTGVEAALWTRKVISATIDAISSMYGNITAVALRAIAATISATSSAYGNITVALQLAISATIGAISSVNANIFAIRAIAAIITAATNVIASLHAIFGIRAVITGVSGMIADIYKVGVGPVVTAGRHLIGYLKRKIEKAINDFLHIE